jgi:hypothetical protein
MDADVRSLLAEHVDSVEKLELIALLSQHRVAWTVVTAGEQLGAPAAVVEAALAELHRAGLLAIEPGAGYVWRPADSLAAAAEPRC